MRDLAPEILRQRLLIEGIYSIEVNQEKVASYLLGVAAHLDIRTYGEPIIHAPEGMGKAENQEFDAFIPLIDSGISLYVWRAAQFFAIVLFTCKAFPIEEALAYTQTYFGASELEYQEF